MWRPGNPVSDLDDIATVFLSEHGEKMPAEPFPQTFRWQRWSTSGVRKVPDIYVPVASFLDIPRVGRFVSVRPRDIGQCSECGERSMGVRCARCRQRQVRADFIAGCEERQGNATAIFQAMITQAAWEGSWEDGTLARVVIAPEAGPEEEIIRSDLTEAFSIAMEANAEPEVFRQLVIDAGHADVIAERDARALEKEQNRVARAEARQRGYATPPPLLLISPSEAREQAKELIAKPRFSGGRWLATRSRWLHSDYVALQVFLRARTDPAIAADAVGRSPTSMAWRAHEVGFHLPEAWRKLLKVPKGEARRA
jgi:hypothetical protein